MTISKAVVYVALILGFGLQSRYAFAQGTAVGVLQSSKSPTPESPYKLFSNDYSFAQLEFANQPGQLELYWKSRIYGEGANRVNQSSEVGGFDVNVDGRYTLVESLQANVSLRGKYESGRSQSVLGDLEPSNRIFIREATIRYNVANVNIFDLTAGVINQDWMDLDMLTDRQSFPGVMGDVHYAFNSSFQLGANAQFLIPTSQSLSSRTSNREATPSYQTQMLYAKYADGSLNAKQTVGHYTFKSLPSIVAWDSSQVGNDFTQAYTPINSRFVYGFNGWFTQSEVGYRVTSVFEPYAYLNMLKNNDAPEENSDGQVIGLGAHFHLEEHLISATYERSYMESDAVPGAYNSWARGHTNSEGNGGEIAVAFLKYKFRIRAQYYDNKAIIINNNQQDTKYFYLGVETGYDKI